MIELRLAKLNDAKNIFEMQHEDEFRKYYLSGLIHEDIYKTKKEIKEFTKLSKNKNAFLFIILKDEKFAGTIDIWKTNKKHKRTCIGYGIKKEYWKKGIATIAVKKALKFIKEEMKLHAVEATTHKKNIASQKVLLKNGFKKVGLMKDYYFDNDEFIDRILFWKVL